MSKVLVFAETSNNKIKSVTYEILNRLQDLDCDVVSIGKLNDEDVKKLSSYNVKNTTLIEGDELDNYSAEMYSNALSSFLKDNKYDYVLTGATSSGKDFFPRLASTLNTGVASDVTDISVKDGQVFGTKPFYAGKCLADFEFTGEGPHFISVRPNSLGQKEGTSQGETKVHNFSSPSCDLKSKIKEVIKSASEKLDLTEANIIVSGGRAMKNKENFSILHEMADVIGATVGASRAAVDSGYADASMQVGQTGKTVSPTLYIACGISGAIQHLAGMRTSKVIVAINTDPDAPIFSKADYGIVGDLFTVVPLLTEELKKVLNK